MSLLKLVRGQMKASLGPRLGVHQPTLSPLPFAQMQRVVIVRPNPRIGNTLFLLPLLDELAAMKPAPWVDLVVGNQKLAADLFAGHPAIRSILAVPVLGRTRLGDLVSAFKLIRDRDLDLIIDPTPNSTTSRLLVALSRCRYRLGFAGSDQWVRLTHAVKQPATPMPAWRLPLELLRACGNEGLTPAARDMSLPLTTAERRVGLDFLHRQLAAGGSGPEAVPVVGFFCDARGEKRRSEQWWRAWQAEFSGRGQYALVQILNNREATALCPGVPAVFVKGLRQLAGVLSNLELFVSCDTGPMHLAAAAGAPVSALFSHTDPEVFGPQSLRDQITAVEEVSITELVSRQISQLEALKYQQVAVQ